MKHSFILFAVLLLALCGFNACDEKDKVEEEIKYGLNVKYESDKDFLYVDEEVEIKITSEPEGFSLDDVTYAFDDKDQEYVEVKKTETGYKVKGLKKGSTEVSIFYKGELVKKITIEVKEKPIVKMISLQADTYTMGNANGVWDEAKTEHEVTLNAFKMGETEITQAQYKKIIEWAKNDDNVKKLYADIAKANAEPSHFNDNPAEGEKQENRPVEMVTWYDAVMFCNLLTMYELSENDCAYEIKNITWNETDGYISEATVTLKNDWLTKKGYRLPTEAEWEYAAKAGNGNDLKYAGTNDDNELGDYAWYKDNSDGKSHEVKKKQPNEWELYDMSGNVWEWCLDWYASSYDSNATNNPTGASSDTHRVRRGGGWSNVASACTVFFRGHDNPFGRYANLGFRVVCSK